MFGAPIPAIYKPPIKYAPVSFPYSSKPLKKKEDDDYI
jgi:hypothetical protein